MTTRVTKLFVAEDVAVSSTGVTSSNATDGAVVAFKKDWTQLGAAETISNSDYIFIMQRIVSATEGVGNIASSEIKGTAVRNYRGDKFRPAANQIAYIGLAPSATTIAAGTGSITVNPDTVYSLAIINLAEKTIRQVPRRYYYSALSSDTELEIGTGIVTEVNNDPDSFVTATLIGNGTGTSGLTGATAYGIKLKGNSTLDYFSVGVGGGFETTPITYDADWFAGVNTYSQLRELEKEAQGNRGYYNRIMLPKDITYFVLEQSNSVITSANATGTVTFTQNSKVVGLSHNVTSDLAVGDLIYVNSVPYFVGGVTGSAGSISAFTLTEPFKASTVTYTASSNNFVAGQFAKGEGYDTIVIEHDHVFTRPETDGYATRPETTVIAIPSYVTNATALSTIQTCLNAYMASTPGAFSGAGL